MKRRIIGVIPVRFGSIRLPGKPLAIINGHPMIWHVYFRAKKAHALQQVIVATDDMRIFDVAKGFGGEVRMTSTTHLSGTDRVAEVASREGLKLNDIVVNIQGDEPLVKGKMIDELVSPFRDKNVVMATLVHPIRGRPAKGTATTAVGRSASNGTHRVNFAELKDENVVKVVFDKNHNALYFSRSPIPARRDSRKGIIYWKHLGFYAYTYEFLKKFTALSHVKLENVEKLEQLRALEHGYHIRVVETEYNTVSVDTLEDLRKVRRLFRAELYKGE